MPSTKPHIAFVLPNLARGGTERATFAIAGGLLARGYAVDMLLIEPYIQAEVADWIPDKVRLFSTPAQVTGGGAVQNITALPPPSMMSYTKGYLRIMCGLRHPPRPRQMRQVGLVASYLAHHSPDVIFPGLDEVYTTLMVRHFIGHSPPIVPIFHVPTKVTRRYRRTLMHTATRAVTVSHGLAATLQRESKLPAERIAAIYNPVVTAETHTQKNQPPDHPWFSDGGAPIILGCGRLEYQKGFDVLLHAFARLRTLHPCRLILLGEGSERSALENLAAELGISSSVSLPGWVDNPLAYMANAKLFTLSSNFEPMGLVLVEALACGCPCVSTDCPSGPAEILQNGEVGELTPVGDHRALANAMLRTLQNPPPPEKLTTRGNYFSLERATDAYEQLISEVIGQGRG